MDGAEELCDTGWLARLLAMPAPPTPLSERPKEVLRGAWWSTARSILRRGHAGDDVVATCAQEVAGPSTAPARRVGHVGQDPFVSRRRFAAPVFARLDAGYRHARDGRTCLSACSPMQNVGDGEAESAHREARAHSARSERAYRRVQPQAPLPAGQPAWVRRYDHRIWRLDRGYTAHNSFGEGSTMNNYLLDSLFDECWPDTPS